MNALEIAQAVLFLGYTLRRASSGDSIVLLPDRPGDTRTTLVFKNEEALSIWLHEQKYLASRTKIIRLDT